MRNQPWSRDDFVAALAARNDARRFDALDEPVRFPFNDSALKAAKEWMDAISGAVGRPVRFSRSKDFGTDGFWLWTFAAPKHGDILLIKEGMYETMGCATGHRYVLVSRAFDADHGI